jgi:hypothetical protein
LALDPQKIFSYVILPSLYDDNYDYVIVQDRLIMGVFELGVRKNVKGFSADSMLQQNSYDEL